MTAFVSHCYLSWRVVLEQEKNTCAENPKLGRSFENDNWDCFCSHISSLDFLCKREHSFFRILLKHGWIRFNFTSCSTWSCIVITHNVGLARPPCLLIDVCRPEKETLEEFLTTREELKAYVPKLGKLTYMRLQPRTVDFISTQLGIPYEDASTIFDHVNDTGKHSRAILMETTERFSRTWLFLFSIKAGIVARPVWSYHISDVFLRSRIFFRWFMK